MTLQELMRADWANVIANTDDFAITCRHSRMGQVALTVNLDGARKLQRSDLTDIPGVDIRAADFVGPIAAFNASDPTFEPLAGDELEWTDADNQVHTFVVFPRVGQRCYDFAGYGRDGLRFYTVAKESLLPLQVTLATGTAPFTVNAVMGAVVGASQFTDIGQESRLLTTVAYVSRSDMEAKGVSSPPPAAKLDCHNLTNWDIELAQTEWGEGLVKIGLVRETLVRQWQGRRNAAV